MVRATTEWLCLVLWEQSFPSSRARSCQGDIPSQVSDSPSRPQAGARQLKTMCVSAFQPSQQVRTHLRPLPPQPSSCPRALVCPSQLAPRQLEASLPHCSSWYLEISGRIYTMNTSKCFGFSLCFLLREPVVRYLPTHH